MCFSLFSRTTTEGTMQYFVLKALTIAHDWMQAKCCTVAAPEALGMVTAKDVVCVSDVPNYTCALRDGWAVNSDDNGSARTPADWSVENGQKARSLGAHQAVWVNTGGALPKGADAVIACRDATDVSLIDECVTSGQNVEFQGADWKEGEVIVPAQTRVGAREMALLFEAGVKTVSGWASPRVAVVATGSEMLAGTESLSTGCRRCSNASYIAALMSRIGVKDVATRVIVDDPEILAATLKELDADYDVVITVGGTGKGKRDYTRKAVEAAGGVFVGSDTQMDSPFVSAKLPHAALIGLPGNPLAVMMIVQCVLLETVRNIFHLPETPAQTVEARISEDIDSGIAGKLCVSLKTSVETRVPQLTACPVLKGTGRMRVFESAVGFVRLTGQGLKRGDTVTVELFRN